MYRVFTDGGSRGNPGRAAIGGVVINEVGQITYKYKKFIGINTNNFAVYASLINALKYCIDNNIQSVRVFSDSQLMVNQINKEFKVSSANIKPLFNEAEDLISKIKDFKIEWNPRESEFTRIADKLVNEALDES